MWLSSALIGPCVCIGWFRDWCPPRLRLHHGCWPHLCTVLWGDQTLRSWSGFSDSWTRQTRRSAQSHDLTGLQRASCSDAVLVFCRFRSSCFSTASQSSSPLTWLNRHHTTQARHMSASETWARVSSLTSCTILIGCGCLISLDQVWTSSVSFKMTIKYETNPAVKLHAASVLWLVGFFSHRSQPVSVHVTCGVSSDSPTDAVCLLQVTGSADVSV